MTDTGGEKLQDTAELLKLVGARVRHARELKGIPRRVLSDMSGVSPRYLAQLESGEGNISIALLHRVSAALGHRVEWMIGEEDPWKSETLRMAELFRHADGSTRLAVMQALEQAPDTELRQNRVALVGLRGAGKSTLGQMVGDQLKVPFTELNREIEEIGGMPISEIMALYGQEGYRQLEFDALDKIASKHQSVILAVAGGIVAEPSTFHRLLTNFHTVWLQASAQEHMDRVRAQGDERPMAGNPEAMEQLKSLLRSREVLYAQSHAQLDTSGKDVSQSLQELSDLIAAKGFLTAS